MAKDQDVRDEFKKKSCLVCLKKPSDPCHIKTYATTLEDDPNNIMPLCREHHTEQHKIGIVTFIRKYPIVLRHVIKLGYYINESGKLAKAQATDDTP